MPSFKYGNDVMLLDGDILFNADGDLYTVDDYEERNKEYAKFEGYYNILFSLYDRLITIKGDNVFHIDYGSDVYRIISRPNSANLPTVLSEVIKNSLLEDNRVADVQSVLVQQNDKIISVSVSVTLTGSDVVSEFIFPNFIIE